MRRFYLLALVVWLVSCRTGEDRWEWRGLPSGGRDAACTKVRGSSWECIGGGVRYTCVVDRKHRHEENGDLVTPVECARVSPMQPSEAP